MLPVSKYILLDTTNIGISANNPSQSCFLDFIELFCSKPDSIFVVFVVEAVSIFQGFKLEPEYACKRRPYQGPGQMPLSDAPNKQIDVFNISDDN